MSAVINEQSFDKIMGYVHAVKQGKVPKTKILFGGKGLITSFNCTRTDLVGDKSEGYYIEPTVILTEDPKAPTMVNELFGPVVTIYVYPSSKFEETVRSFLQFN